MARDVDKLFVGKTVTKVDTSAVNCWFFHFTDGSVAAVEVEGVQPSIGLYGMKLVKTQGSK